MSKQPKHSADFLFGNSPRAKQEARELTQGKGRVLCEGCLEELAHRIDEVYKFKYLLMKAEKKLAKQKKALKIYRERWKELRKVIARKRMPDIDVTTNLDEFFRRFKDRENE